MKPRTAWINGVNLSGLWFDKPKRGCLGEDGSYWHQFNFDAPIGLRRNDLSITFASFNKAEAEAFTLGALAISEILAQAQAYWGARVK